jgi:hypothetical protein
MDPTGRRLVSSAYQSFVDEVQAAGSRVVWVTPPDIHLVWRGISSPLDDRRRWRALREVVAELRVTQIDLPAWLRRNDLDGPSGRADGVHLVPDVNERFVEEAVVPVLVRLSQLPAVVTPTRRL